MFWDNFLELCVERGTRPNPVAKELGISSATVTKWKKGSVPGGVILEKLSAYFGVSVNRLLGCEGEADAELSSYLEELKNRPEMRMLFSLAKGATKDDVEKAVKIIEALRSNEQ